jgi:hypothetical protein
VLEGEVLKPLAEVGKMSGSTNDSGD